MASALSVGGGALGDGGEGGGRLGAAAAVSSEAVHDGGGGEGGGRQGAPVTVASGVTRDGGGGGHQPLILHCTNMGKMQVAGSTRLVAPGATSLV